MANTKQTYLYGRFLFTSGTPDMTPIRFVRANSKTAEVACYPNSLMVLVRIPKKEIIHHLKTTANPSLYTFFHQSGNASGTYVLAEEAWTRPHDIDASYEPFAGEVIKQMQKLVKPKKQHTPAQWASITIGKTQHTAREKVNACV